MFANTTKILIVDDMATMRKIVRKNLMDLGFQTIEEADDGETAWPMIEKSVAENKPYELIISDWNMPKLKGIELLRRVRGVAALKKLPFILLTAEAEKTQIMEAIQAGVSNYITKPFTADTLRDKMRMTYENFMKQQAKPAGAK